jgi:urease accessory protein
MRRAVRVLPAGTWAQAERVATATLAFDQRYRRRIVLADDDGLPFLLDLPRATVLGDGDGLALDAGGVIGVAAAAEPVADVQAVTVADAVRLAWHLGNRHAEVQILADGSLRVRDDPVVLAMLEGLGGRISRGQAPFQPERGAYADAASHRHDG